MSVFKSCLPCCGLPMPKLSRSKVKSWFHIKDKTTDKTNSQAIALSAAPSKDSVEIGSKTPQSGASSTNWVKLDKDMQNEVDTFNELFPPDRYGIPETPQTKPTKVSTARNSILPPPRK